MSKTGPTLILDIDSGSVGACVLTEGGERPTMSKVTRIPVGTGAVREPAALIPLLKDALGLLLPKYADTKPSKIAVVVASPWFSAHMRTLTSKSEKQVKVSRSTVDRVVTEYAKEHPSGAKALESVPILVSVNGYRTAIDRPVYGSTLAVTLYETATDTALIETVSAQLDTFAPHTPVSWHSTPLVYAETILRLSGYEYGTVVDVGSEITDVVVMSKRTIGFVGSIPEGSRSIIRTISGKGSLADTASRLVMMTKGDLKDEERTELSKALTAAGTSWQKSFTDLLQEAGNTIPVPHHVFVVGERDELQWFKLVVDTSATRGATPTAITPDFFNGSVGFGEGGSYDASLALALLFVHIKNGATLPAFFGSRVIYSKQ